MNVCKAFKKALHMVEYEQVTHPDLKLQERVLCYELYHQLRLLEMREVIDFRPARLQGELNKQAQHLFHEKEPIPDFLVHEPGTDNHNLGVVEVKRASANNEDLQYDLWKLARFANHSELRYHEVILLISGKQEELNQAWTRIKRLSTRTGTTIQVLLHEVVNASIEHRKIKYSEAKGPGPKGAREVASA